MNFTFRTEEVTYKYKSRGKKTHWYFVTSLLLLSSSVIFPIPIIRKHQLKWILHFSGRDRTDTRPAAPSPWTFVSECDIATLHYITNLHRTNRGQVAKFLFLVGCFIETFKKTVIRPNTRKYCAGLTSDSGIFSFLGTRKLCRFLLFNGLRWRYLWACSASCEQFSNQILEEMALDRTTNICLSLFIVVCCINCFGHIGSRLLSVAYF